MCSFIEHLEALLFYEVLSEVQQSFYKIIVSVKRSNIVLNNDKLYIEDRRLSVVILTSLI